jgi:hypothetical protein
LFVSTNRSSLVGLMKSVAVALSLWQRTRRSMLDMRTVEIVAIVLSGQRKHDALNSVDPQLVVYSITTTTPR